MLMLRAFPALLMFLLLLALSAPLDMASPQKSDNEVFVGQGFITTEKYIGFGEDKQAIYAAGLMDGIALAPLFGSPSKDKTFVTIKTCLNGMTNTQVAAIITKYTKEHPEKWHYGTNVVAYQSLRESCPVQ